MICRAFRVVPLLLAVATTACVRVSAGIAGDDINGQDVERAIRTGLVPFVRSLDSTLSIGSAKCPSRIDVSNGKVGYCVLNVNGVPLRIHVLYNGPPQYFRANFDGSLYWRRETEDFVEKNLASMYGVLATAHCIMPGVQVLKPNNTVECVVEGTSFSIVRVRTLSDNDLYLYPPVGIKPVFPELQVALRKHKAKKRVLLDGKVLQRYVDHWVTTEGFAKSAFRPTIGPATCPKPSDLSAQRTAICTVPFDQQNVRYQVSLDNALGVKVNVLDAVIGRARLEQYAQQLLEQQLQANGQGPVASVTVHCGSLDLIVTPAPGKLYCRISVGGQPGRLLVNVQDANGTINIGGIQMDK